MPLLLLLLFFVGGCKPAPPVPPPSPRLTPGVLPTAAPTDIVAADGPNNPFRVAPFPIKVTESLSFVAAQFPGLDAAQSRKGIEVYFAKYATLPSDKQLSPFDWFRDARLTSVLLRAEPRNARALEGARLLDAFMERFLRPQDNALFVVYPNSHSVRQEGTAPRVLHAPWVSALGNGFVASGYLELWRVTGNRSYKDKADQLFAAFFQHRTRQPGRLWFTYVDEEGYLWFEEFVFPDDPQMHVFNGNNYAVMALYEYYLSAPSDEVMTYIRAGVTTMFRHLEEYRVPGKISKGWLSPYAVRDYGPRRALNQLQWLADVSGEPYFAAMRATYVEDFRISKRPLK